MTSFRLLLLALIVVLAGPADAQRQSFQRAAKAIPALTVCLYGDSLVDDNSPSGNQTAGFESGGVCDFCDPLVDAGMTIISMGRNGAESTSDGGEAENCAGGYEDALCTTDGDNVALTCDASCDNSVSNPSETTSCRNVVQAPSPAAGVDHRDSTCVRDMTEYCDVFAYLYGTNDSSEAVTANTFDLDHQQFIEDVASYNRPGIVWIAPTYWSRRSRAERLDADYRAEIATALAAVTNEERRWVTVLDAWSLFRDIGTRYGLDQERLLFDDANSGNWSQAEWDADTTQTGGGDYVHPERFVDNGAPEGLIGANYLGQAFMRAVLSAHANAPVHDSSSSHLHY